VVTSITSCRKEEKYSPPVVQNITANLKVNESYTFTLPSTDSKHPYTITTAAQHSSISLLNKGGNGNDIYQYTPALNYSGSDFVSIANFDNHQGPQGNGCQNGGGCGHGGHHGGCDDDDGQQNIVNITFNVGTSTTATTSTFTGNDK
jgi:hypothetical protein